MNPRPSHRDRSLRGLAHALAVLLVWIGSALVARDGLAGALGDPPNDLATRPLQQPVELARLFSSLGSIQRVSAAFDEEKSLAILAKPLRVTGMIYFVRDRGFARVNNTPRPQKVVLTDSALHLWDGSATTTTSLARGGDVAALASALPLLLKGEQSKLAAIFDMSLRGTPSTWWRLTLAPRAKSLGKMVRQITIVGHATTIASLEVLEANGDRSFAVFHDVAINGVASPAAMAAWLAVPGQ